MQIMSCNLPKMLHPEVFPLCRLVLSASDLWRIGLLLLGMLFLPPLTLFSYCFPSLSPSSHFSGLLWGRSGG